MLAEANPYRYMYMRLPKIRQVLEECPIAIQPTGLLEWHGEQSPIGLDGMLAHYIGERAMIKIGNGALFPANFIGTYGYIRYPGTMCFDQATVISVFTQMYREMIKLGFKVILILLGHWGQIQQDALRIARETVEQEIKEKNLAVKILGLRWADYLIGMGYGGHGKEGETAMIWRMSQHYGLDLVDVSNFQVGEENVAQYTIEDENVPKREEDIWKWEKDLSDPTICSPETGETMIDIISDGIAEDLTDQLNELGYSYQLP